jgi:hypothetical protein
MGNLCGMMAGEDKKGIALLREVGMEEDNAPPVAKYLKEGGDPDLWSTSSCPNRRFAE